MIYTGPMIIILIIAMENFLIVRLNLNLKQLMLKLFQPTGTINYPNEHPYTRITEFKYLTGQKHPKTTIVYEYPKADGDPYYPVPRPENTEIYKKYQQLAAAEPKYVHFTGRLATYKYYNMDQVVAQSLTLFKNIAGNILNDQPLNGKKIQTLHA